MDGRIPNAAAVAIQLAAIQMHMLEQIRLDDARINQAGPIDEVAVLAQIRLDIASEMSDGVLDARGTAVNAQPLEGLEEDGTLQQPTSWYRTPVNRDEENLRARVRQARITPADTIRERELLQQERQRELATAQAEPVPNMGSPEDTRIQLLIYKIALHDADVNEYVALSWLDPVGLFTTEDKVAFMSILRSNIQTWEHPFGEPDDSLPPRHIRRSGPELDTQTWSQRIEYLQENRERLAADCLLALANTGAEDLYLGWTHRQNMDRILQRAITVTKWQRAITEWYFAGDTNNTAPPDLVQWLVNQSRRKGWPAEPAHFHVHDMQRTFLAMLGQRFEYNIFGQIIDANTYTEPVSPITPLEPTRRAFSARPAPITQVSVQITEADVLEDDPCGICHMEYEAGEARSTLGCNHRFHTDCITPWISQGGTCPFRCARPSP
ncbi:unnamed protein product [Zymoseptoria tritici ST99CH_1A5]|uniref:RING-type domain-containing protein n=1 Tax=Zymoseptoria tritici ST99CH_1A5 TaxID=1276529 RepID=A0A1Y6M290_ZYMTR|nr:unnamed protein product [Zymoseptoria tritici ST99CH_1A5]